MPNPGGIQVLLLCCAALSALSAETFRVATYNVQNYLDAPIGTRPAKSDAAKAKVRESIENRLDAVGGKRTDNPAVTPTPKVPTPPLPTPPSSRP